MDGTDWWWVCFERWQERDLRWFGHKRGFGLFAECTRFLYCMISGSPMDSGPAHRRATWMNFWNLAKDFPYAITFSR